VIVAEYTISCDGCGRGDLGSEESRDRAWFCAVSAGWTATPGNFVAQHWCPACTQARKQPTTEE
jgi:hypothetical protein